MVFELFGSCFSSYFLTLCASWDDALASRGGNVVGYDIRSGFVACFGHTDGVIDGACYGHVLITCAGSQRRARDGYYGRRLPEVRRLPSFILTDASFVFKL